MKYNHAFDIAFSLENESPDGEVTVDEIMDALQARVNYLRRHHNEVLESVGAPFETHEVETHESKFPPLRWFRRWLCRCRFSKLTPREQDLAEMLGIDPESLIRRGLL